MTAGPPGQGLTAALRLHGRRSRIAALLLALALGGAFATIGLAFKTLADQSSGARRIDLAGRQRMLNQQHMKEVLLAASGAAVDLAATRREFLDGLEALREAAAIGPRLDLHGRSMAAQIGAADALLATPPTDPRYGLQRSVLGALNDDLATELDFTVRLLDADSAARVAKGLRWIGAAAALMILTGFGLVWQYRRIMRLNRRLQAEERGHRQVAQQLDAVVDSVVDGIVTIDERGTVETLNRAAETIFGWAAAEVVGRNVKMLMPEPFRSEHDGYLELYLRTGTARIIGRPREVEGRRQDGSVFPLELAVSEASTTGRRRFVGVVRDLTAQKATAEALRRSRERFELAVEGSAAGLWDWDVISNEVWYAPRFKAMLGYLDGEFENLFESFETHLHPEDREPTLERVRLHLEERLPYDVEYRLHTKGGEWRWFRARGQALWDADGNPFRMAGSIVDITERLAAREALREATEQAIAANQAKSQFLANMSHELRTPLNAIIGYSELLAEVVVERRVEGFTADLEKIGSAGRQLLGLIDDVLDLSKVEAGRMELSPETFDLHEMLERVVATVQPLFENRGNRLELLPAGNVGAITADRARLRQVILNLVSNANKFTTGGKVTIGAARETVEGRPWLRLEVADTGIGMNAEQLARVFQPFAQADSSTTRKYGGTGLGLAICRQLCEAMGGSIGATSEPGRGSVFTVRLPLAGREWHNRQP